MLPGALRRVWDRRRPGSTGSSDRAPVRENGIDEAGLDVEPIVLDPVLIWVGRRSGPSDLDAESGL
jgi:hypothetical protein